MQKTANYELNKIELQDSPPDITVINPNWDTIDSKLKVVETLTNAVKTKIDTIESGAEVNIQSDWNIADTNSDAYIKNKPSSLPANGGNSDTVDNKHAADFAPSGYGLGTTCKTIEGDLNTIHKTGFYVGGSNLLNTPKDPFNSTGISPNCWYILVMDNNDKWCTQIAVYLADSRYTYIRNELNGAWQNWGSISDNANAQKLTGIVPIASGGTGADNVTNALKNLKLKKDDVFNQNLKSTTLNYGAFSSTGLQSMTMLEFSEIMPIDTSVIFRNTTTNAPCITDTPTQYGEILFIKGPTGNYRYTLYFDSTPGNHDIYYWSADNTEINKNWVKIKDGGNADTVDGKHAHDFVPQISEPNNRGVLWLKSDCPIVSNLKDIPPGTYRCIGQTTAAVLPKGANPWGFLSVFQSIDYKFYQYFDFSDNLYWKRNESEWQKYAKFEDIPTKLPANGGNADTVGGKPVTDFPQGFYKELTFWANPHIWYRILKSDGEACGGVFTMFAGRKAYTSTTVFAATKQYTDGGVNITKLSHASFNVCIDKIRTVKIIGVDGEFIDIHTSNDLEQPGLAELKINFSGLNWKIVAPIQQITVENAITTKTTSTLVL